MKHFFLLFLSVITCSIHAQNFTWARQFGGGFDCYGNDIKTDASGNVYTTGYLNGFADFDPGPGVFNLTPIGRSRYVHFEAECKRKLCLSQTV